jgi:hypothetical protein
MTGPMDSRQSRSRGSDRVRAALGYKDGELVACELQHDAFPSSARSWMERGYVVEIVTQQEALSRWDCEVRRV